MLQNIYLLFMPSEFVIIGPMFYYLNQYFHIIFIFLEVLAGRTGPPRGPQVGHP